MKRSDERNKKRFAGRSTFRPSAELKLWKFNLFLRFFHSPLDQKRRFEAFFFLPFLVVRGEAKQKNGTQEEYSVWVLCCIRQQCSVSRENQYSVNWFVSYQLRELLCGRSKDIRAGFIMIERRRHWKGSNIIFAWDVIILAFGSFTP